MKAKQGHPTVVPTAAQECLAAVRFAVPEPEAAYVSRPRLVDALARTESSRLVLVSGPAGSGKTSLVAEWVRGRAAGLGLVGWISVEEGENAFWEYLLGCLGRMGIDVRAHTDGSTGSPALGRAPLMALAEGIAESPQPLTVVVDGYEMLSLELARDVDFLLRHTFGRLRLVFVARVDPVLPLYRYRLSDALVEVRAADLALTDDEAGRLLESRGLGLGRESVQQLNQRVKGWVAGLRFAAQALAARDDPERSVATVLAQTENINEYLVGEVLEAQTPEVRRFMLDTCVPDVLCPGLVEELAGAGSRHSLVALSRSNTFIETVPDEPECYSYYPFFRDLLRAQLAYESPQRLAELHRTTARWFKRHGLPQKAIAHLAAIPDWDEVAVQVVDGLMVGELMFEGGKGALSEVARLLPDDLGQRSACVVRAAVALTVGDRAGCAEELSRARRTTAFDGARADTVGLCVAVLDALRGSLADDAATANALAEEAQRALDEAQLYSGVKPGSELCALVQLSRGMALFRRGDLGHARKALALAAGSAAGRSFPWFHANCLGYLALIDALDGQLSRASRTAAESLALLDDAGLPRGDRSPAPYVALARVALEQYQLKDAREHVVSAGACRALQGNRIARGVTESVMAGLERASGHLEPALARLKAAAAAAQGDPWLAGYLQVEAARLNLANGRAEGALKALEGIGEHDGPEIAVVVASAYAEQGQSAAVEESLALAGDGEAPLQTQVSRLLVEVVQESRRRSPGRTRVVLDRSLRLAAPEQLRRPFREAGPSVQRLLAADPRLLLEHQWLSASTTSPTHPIPAQRRPIAHLEGAAEARGASQEVVETLTAKELEVLGHLEELLTTEEIAAKMFVSVNTVRTHIRSILRKLGVNRRNAAVRKARELGLVNG